jgi:rare lipoprotein A (peptidoglycan hydrolase)
MPSRGTPVGPVPRDAFPAFVPEPGGPAPQAARRRPSTWPRTTRALLVALPVAVLAACSANPKPRAYPFPPPEAPAVGTVVEGIASWYGPGYDGKRTSSGEVYDQDALTAAHAYWAFGTRVKVTFLATRRSVVVRINDRFPSHKGRAIDLSRGAAKAIGLIGPGTGQVRLEIVE